MAFHQVADSGLVPVPGQASEQLVSQPFSPPVQVSLNQASARAWLQAGAVERTAPAFDIASRPLLSLPALGLPFQLPSQPALSHPTRC